VKSGNSGVVGDGVWVEDQNYRLQPLLHVGSEVLIGSGLKEVHYVEAAPPTSNGQVSLTVTFQDGSEAILLWNGVLQTAAPAGDYNGDGIVDAADYTVWRDSLGTSGSSLAADGNNNGKIDSGDYDVWRTNFGRTKGAGGGANAAVPEPATLWMLLAGILTICCRRRSKVS